MREPEGGKKVLDIFPYGNVLFAHGTSGDNFGCFQRGGGAAAAGNPELSCTARTPVGEIVDSLGLEQPSVSKHLRVLLEVGLVNVRRDGRRMLYRTNAEAIRPASRMDGNVRALLASSIKPRQGTRRAEKQSVKQRRTGFYFKEER